MQLKTILNRVHRQPGFVYGRVVLCTEGGQLVLNVVLHPHASSRGCC